MTGTSHLLFFRHGGRLLVRNEFMFALSSTSLYVTFGPHTAPTGTMAQSVDNDKNREQSIQSQTDGENNIPHQWGHMHPHPNNEIQYIASRCYRI